MKIITLLLNLALLSSKLAAAEADSKVEAVHNELRALRDGLLSAMNAGDIDRELTYLHTNAVITWHNAEVSRGREGVRAYYDRLTSGPNKMVEKFSADVNVDELTILHGENTGISFGSSVEHFKLTGGRSFDLRGRWTATLIKENGKWLVGSLHVSTNIFDNVMLDMVNKRATIGAIIAIVVGLLIGWFVGRGRKAASAPRPA